jgi:DNA-binding HxlR family transcriptional regulator
MDRIDDMAEPELRSDCPINYVCEVIGDKWSLVILRDMLLAGKSRYGEFLASDEGIATNILASRLRTLEDWEIIARVPDPDSPSKHRYAITERGLDLVPLFVEMMLWTAKYRPIPVERREHVRRARTDKAALIRDIRAQFAPDLVTR